MAAGEIKTVLAFFTKTHDELGRPETLKGICDPNDSMSATHIAERTRVVDREFAFVETAEAVELANGKFRLIGYFGGHFREEYELGKFVPNLLRKLRAARKRKTEFVQDRDFNSNTDRPDC